MSGRGALEKALALGRGRASSVLNGRSFGWDSSPQPSGFDSKKYVESPWGIGGGLFAETRRDGSERVGRHCWRWPGEQ